MKIGNRKIPKGNMLLLVGIFVISVCTLLISAALRVDYINGLKTGDFYSEKARKLRVTNSSRNDIWPEIIDKISEDVSIYHQIWDNETELYSIYNQTQTDTFPLLSGHFFTKDEQLSPSPTVVIGKTFQDSLLTRDETLYWEYQGIFYKVIGIMGMPYESRYDDLVLINFMSELSLGNPDGLYLIDSKKKNKVEDALQTIKTNLIGHATVNIPANDEDGWIAMTYDGMQLGSVFYILILFSFFLTLMIMDSLWLSYRRNTVQIYQIQGLFIKEIFWILLQEFERLLLTAWILGILSGFLITAFWGETDILMSDILISLFVTLGIGTLTFFFPLHKLRKINIV